MDFPWNKPSSVLLGYSHGLGNLHISGKDRGAVGRMGSLDLLCGLSWWKKNTQKLGLLHGFKWEDLGNDNEHSGSCEGGSCEGGNWSTPRIGQVTTNNCRFHHSLSRETDPNPYPHLTDDILILFDHVFKMLHRFQNVRYFRCYP